MTIAETDRQSNA